MFRQAFANKLNRLSTGILGIEIEYAFWYCIKWTVCSQVIGKKIKNVEERVFGIFEDARDVQKVGPVRTNVKAPKWTVAISECGPDEIESFCCASGSTSNNWDLVSRIASQGLQQAIRRSKILAAPFCYAMGLINHDRGEACPETGILP